MGPISVDSRRPLYGAIRRSMTIRAGLASLMALSLWAHGQDSDANAPVPADAQEARIKVSRNLDWVPFEQLTDEQRQQARPNCCGAYVEPARDYENASKAPAKSPLNISADETEARGDTANLSGDVQVSQGYRQVRSDSARVDRTARTVELDGDITYREPGVLMVGESADINFESGELDVRQVDFVLHDSGVRGEASSLTRPEEDIFYVDNVLYTTCEPGNNSWALRATSVEIDTEDSVAVARNVRLNIKDVPVLYIPWLRYPLSDNRATGLLFPNILTGNDNGLDYAQPVYLNLAPNYDATLTPRFIQERGMMAEGEFRHLSRTTRTTLSGGYLWDDDGGSSNDPDFLGEDRWSGKIDHRGGFGEAWNTRIDYTDVSDIDYFRDIDTATLQLNSASHLNQQVRVGYNTNHWEFSAQGQQFETLILDGRDQYRQLPRLDANAHYRFGDSDLVLTLKQHFVRFDHSEDDVTGSGTPLTTDAANTTITGNRLRANYSLVWDRDWLWGHFRPRLTTKYISYNLDDPLMGRDDKTPDAFVPVVSVDTGLYFERDMTLLTGMIHTLEPRLYYVRSEYENQSAIPNFDTSDLTFGYYQLFRDDRFSGGDRIGDTEQVTFGLTTRLIDSRTGAENFRFSIGQVYYIEDRQVTLAPQAAGELTRDSSDIAAEVAGRLGSDWRYQMDLLANDDDSVINKGSMSLRYNDGEDTIFNFSYRYTRRENVLSGNRFVRADIDQVDTSFAVPISDSWSVLGRYNYDLNTSQELEIFAGLQYNSCCWSASVVARRWIDRDDNFIIGSDNLEHNNGIFFQVQFRGLAGTGTRVDNILSEGIYGYQPQDD